MSNRPLMLLFFLFASSLSPAVMAESSARCPAFDGSTVSLDKCDGQIVEFVAAVASAVEVEQHPTGMGEQPVCTEVKVMNPNGVTHCIGSKFEIYGRIHSASDVKTAGQLVFRSSKAIDCPNLFHVSGRVKMVSLGGAPNTKNAYRRAWIEVIDYECKD